MQLKHWLVILVAACLPVLAIAQTGEESIEDAAAAYQAKVDALLEKLKPMHGEHKLAKAPMTVNIPPAYDFYGPRDTQTILEDLWGNPPDDTVSGMLFPAGMSPMDDGSWGAVLTYEKTGYVTDDDAATTDYGELLRNMQQEALGFNEARREQGYPTLEIIGWAADPRYDAASHKVSWAKDILFSGNDGVHTLNYDMRALGRHGVLSINFIASMDDLRRIEAAAPEVIAIPTFKQGSRYEDYVEGDKKAGYGVAALVAGGAGIVALKKGGLLVVLMLLLKKGWIILLIGGAALARFAKRLFGGAREE